MTTSVQSKFVIDNVLDLAEAQKRSDSCPHDVGPSPIGPSFAKDICIDMETIVKVHIARLRLSGKLRTESEIGLSCRSERFTPVEDKHGKKWWNKGREIHRLWGRDSIDQEIKARNYQLLRVPQKILVIPDGQTSLTFEGRHLEGAVLFAENIEPRGSEIKRLITEYYGNSSYVSSFSVLHAIFPYISEEDAKIVNYEVNDLARNFKMDTYEGLSNFIMGTDHKFYYIDTEEGATGPKSKQSRIPLPTPLPESKPPVDELQMKIDSSKNPYDHSCSIFRKHMRDGQYKEARSLIPHLTRYNREILNSIAEEYLEQQNYEQALELWNTARGDLEVLRSPLIALTKFLISVEQGDVVAANRQIALLRLPEMVPISNRYKVFDVAIRELQGHFPDNEPLRTLCENARQYAEIHDALHAGHDIPSLLQEHPKFFAKFPTIFDSLLVRNIDKNSSDIAEALKSLSLETPLSRFCLLIHQIVVNRSQGKIDEAIKLLLDPGEEPTRDIIETKKNVLIDEIIPVFKRKYSEHTPFCRFLDHATNLLKTC